MIRTFDLKKNSEAYFNVDLLRHHFKFHPLAIEDSIYSLNKPKLDYYEDYSFLILNALQRDIFTPVEISLFASKIM